MSKEKRCGERISGHPPSLPVAGGLSWWIVASRNPSIPNWTVGCSSQLRGDHISNILFTRRALVFNIPLNCSPQVKEDYVQDTSHKLLGFSEEFPTYLSLGELVGLSFSTLLATLRKILSSILDLNWDPHWYKDSNQQPIPKGMGLNLEIELRPVLVLLR